MPNAPVNPFIRVRVRSIKESARKIPVPEKPDPVLGKFWFDVDVSAGPRDVYVPLSVASGKKPTGFVYQIEGTTEGTISTTDISCEGDGITQVTLGTLLYAKIPALMTASFRIRIEMRGRLGKSYRVVLRQINFKLDPGDARYQKLPQDISGKMLKFR